MIRLNKPHNYQLGKKIIDREYENEEKTNRIK